MSDIERKVEQLIIRLRDNSNHLRNMVAEPAPPNLSADQAKELLEHSEWCHKTIARIAESIKRWQSEINRANTEEVEAFHMDMVMLQNYMQKESLRISAMSNINNVLHETAKNIIKNIR
jgi:hypothetical protein